MSNAVLIRFSALAIWGRGDRHCFAQGKNMMWRRERCWTAPAASARRRRDRRGRRSSTRSFARKACGSAVDMPFEQPLGGARRARLFAPCALGALRRVILSGLFSAPEFMNRQFAPVFLGAYRRCNSTRDAGADSERSSSRFMAGRCCWRGICGWALDWRTRSAAGARHNAASDVPRRLSVRRLRWHGNEMTCVRKRKPTTAG